MRKLAFVLVILGAAWMSAPVVSAAAEQGSPPPTTVSERRVTETGERLGVGQLSGTRSVPEHTTLISVEWEGDPAASFVVETQQTDSTWRPLGEVGDSDTGPDPGTADAARVAGRTALVSEPLYVEDPTKVRLRLTEGTATEVRLTAIASPPDTRGAPSLPVAPGVALIGAAGLIGFRGSRRASAVLVVLVVVTGGFVGLIDCRRNPGAYCALCDWPACRGWFVRYRRATDSRSGPRHREHRPRAVDTVRSPSGSLRGECTRIRESCRARRTSARRLLGRGAADQDSRRIRRAAARDCNPS